MQSWLHHFRKFVKMSTTMRSTLQTVPESLPTDHITNPLGTTATTTATTETTTTKSSHSHTSNPLKGRATSTKVCYVKLCFGKLLFFWGPWCTKNLLHFKRSCYRLFSYAVSIFIFISMGGAIIISAILFICDK